MTTVSKEQVLTGEPVPVRLMNTNWGDANGVHDSLQSSSDARDWLASVGAPLGAVARDDHEEARRLRDALRRLAAVVTDDPRTAAASPLSDAQEAAAIVNAQAAKRPVIEIEIATDERGGVRLAPVSRVQDSAAASALAGIAAEAQALFTGPTASDLRACLAPGCVRYFMKTHARREWCCDACGNRARAARHYGKVRARRSAAE